MIKENISTNDLITLKSMLSDLQEYNRSFRSMLFFLDECSLNLSKHYASEKNFNVSNISLARLMEMLRRNNKRLDELFKELASKEGIFNDEYNICYDSTGDCDYTKKIKNIYDDCTRCIAISKLEDVEFEVAKFYIQTMTCCFKNYGSISSNGVDEVCIDKNTRRGIPKLIKISRLLTNPNELDFKILEARAEKQRIQSYGDIATAKTANYYLEYEEELKDKINILTCDYYNTLAEISNEKQERATFPFINIWNKSKIKKGTSTKDGLSYLLNLRNVGYNLEDERSLKAFLKRCVLEKYDLDCELEGFNIVSLISPINKLVMRRDELIYQVLKKLEAFYLEEQENNVEKALNELLDVQTSIVSILRKLTFCREEHLREQIRFCSMPLSLETTKMLEFLEMDENKATKEAVLTYFNNVVNNYVVYEHRRLNDKREKERKEHLNNR